MKRVPEHRVTKQSSKQVHRHLFEMRAKFNTRSSMVWRLTCKCTHDAFATRVALGGARFSEGS